MYDEDTRLKDKLQRLEEVLEKQRWAQKEQLLKFEKTVEKLEKDLEQEKFTAEYNKEQIGHYKLVLESLPYGVYMMDERGNVSALNSLGKSLISKKQVAQILLEASAGNDVQESICGSEEDEAKGSLVNVEAHPLRNENGALVGSIALLTRVTPA